MNMAIWYIPLVYIGISLKKSQAIAYHAASLKLLLLQEKESEFINRIHGFIQFAPGNTCAMDISFGSTGCAYILAWAFQEVSYNEWDNVARWIIS